jgi:hypothetical protein
MITTIVSQLFNKSIINIDKSQNRRNAVSIFKRSLTPLTGKQTSDKAVFKI